MKQIILSIITIILLAGCAPAPIEVVTTVEVIKYVTATPIPLELRPVHITGSGDDLVSINKSDTAAVIDIKYTGDGNFAVQTYDKNNEQIELLVNTIGSYSGRLLMDIRDTDHTERIQVESEGKWDMTITPLESANIKIIGLPGIYSSSGDNIFMFSPGNVDYARIDAPQSKGNFAVYVWSEGQGRDLIVNEIGAFTGKIILPRDAFLIEVFAEGPWSIEVQRKK